MPDKQNAKNSSERNDADMNRNEFVGQLEIAEWSEAGTRCLINELGNGMQYRIWRNNDNSFIIGYGTWDPNQIGNVQEIFQNNRDGFILGRSAGKYIVLKYRNRRIQLRQVREALNEFQEQLRRAGVLPGGGEGPVEGREVRPSRPPAPPAQVPLLNDGFWNEPAHNPWLDERSLRNTNSLFLEDDRESIDAYQPEDDNYRLHGEAYPQPYIGYPTARIWLLMKNPSYSPVDEAEITGAISEDLRTRFDFRETSSPDARRDLLRDQLAFAQRSIFYPLEEDFHVWYYNGGAPQGSYRWWEQKLLGMNPNAAPVCKSVRKRLESFFDLEFFPYHSRNFDSGIAGLARQVAHYRFWQKMVKYALENNKILILRRFMLNEVTRVAGEELFREKIGNIFLLSRNACISVGNLKLTPGFTPPENEGEDAYIARRLAEAMGLTKQEEKDLLPS